MIKKITPTNTTPIFRMPPNRDVMGGGGGAINGEGPNNPESGGGAAGFEENSPIYVYEGTFLTTS
jgi:hypothetical protein